MPTPDELREIKAAVQKSWIAARKAREDNLFHEREKLRARARNNMTHHTPGPEAVHRIETLRDVYKGVAELTITHGIPSQELNAAIGRLESALQYTIASIVRHPEDL